ncbi:MAG: inositol monophosphatase family protein [Terricaulis sp.]
MTTPALADLIQLARDAGREIMAVRAAGFESQQKLDGSIVTLADQRAEAIIEAGLAKLAPGVPMLAEEAAAAGRIPQCGARFFCVDPLDGTRGFAKGGNEFTVNIALVENGAPVVGVIFAPASGELYAGEPGRTAKARYDVKSEALVEPLSAMTTPRGQHAPWRVVASDFSGRNETTGKFLAALGETTTIHASSSIKFCRVAEGAADLYPRFGDVSEWDAAAGHAILNAAGGGVMRLDGANIFYGGSNGDVLIHGFCAYANEDAKAAALQAMPR